MQYARGLRICNEKNPFSQNFVKFDFQEIRIITETMKNYHQSKATRDAPCVSEARMDF